MSKKEIITKKRLQEFGFILGIGFPLIIGWLFPYISGHFFRTWTLIIGIPILFLAIFLPEILQVPYKIWMQIGLILGWLNSRIILGLIFLLVLIPISFIMKIFKYDPLQKGFYKEKKSYREVIKNHETDLTKIF